MPIGASKDYRSNPATDIYNYFAALPTKLRAAVCDRCNWSDPTFYRKLRTGQLPRNKDGSVVVAAMSELEMEVLLKKAREIYNEAGAFLSQYEKEISIS
jgi:hypothetical protein